jgi:hypothetical protein
VSTAYAIAAIAAFFGVCVIAAVALYPFFIGREDVDEANDEEGDK